ncbi:MAG: glycoside hydrolase family 1 protein [Chitinophagaceae bacterium]
MNQATLTNKQFGNDFQWGIAISAAQNEGAYLTDGRSLSIWDQFAKTKGKIKDGGKPSVACDFYHRYKDDLLLVKALGFQVFRFSISWSRILPDGIGRVNKAGIQYYHNVIDECLSLGLVPYITLYHWDLPLCLEKQGGWSSHLLLKWFTRFVTVCAEEYGSKVKNWIVLNEPFGFTSLGYMVAQHAPGKMSVSQFMSAIHNAVLAQAEGGRILRKLVPNAHIGTSFSCSEVMPYTTKPNDILAAKRADILLNRLMIEPALGRGYPQDDHFPFLEKLQLHTKAWKYVDKMTFNFDFIGIQNYFALTVKHNSLIPYLQASEVKAAKRKVPHTAMGWEINADSFYRMLKRYWLYGSVKSIIVTEGGAYFKDEWVNGRINDSERIQYFKDYLQALNRAQQEGVNIKGYFAWTLMDNFEWAEGYKARFGIVHHDHKTQLRTIKESGHWWRNFLALK